MNILKANQTSELETVPWTRQFKSVNFKEFYPATPGKSLLTLFGTMLDYLNFKLKNTWFTLYKSFDQGEN